VWTAVSLAAASSDAVRYSRGGFPDI